MTDIFAQADVFLNILCYIPPKDIIRSKRVCKSWLSTLSSNRSEAFWRQVFFYNYSRRSRVCNLFTNTIWHDMVYSYTLAAHNWKHGLMEKRTLCGDGGAHEHEGGWNPCADVVGVFYDFGSTVKVWFYVLEAASRGWDQFVLMERRSVDEPIGRNKDQVSVIGGFSKYYRTMHITFAKDDALYAAHGRQSVLVCHDVMTASNRWSRHLVDIFYDSGLLHRNDPRTNDVYGNHPGTVCCDIKTTSNYVVVATYNDVMFLLDKNSGEFVSFMTTNPNNKCNENVYEPYCNRPDMTIVTDGHDVVFAVTERYGLAIDLRNHHKQFRVDFNKTAPLEDAYHSSFGTCLAVCAADETVIIWDISTESLIEIKEPFMKKPFGVHICDKDTLLIADNDSIWKYSISTSESNCLVNSFERPDSIVDIFQQHGDLIAIVKSTSVQIWNWVTNEKITEISLNACPSYIDFSFSHLIIGDKNGNVVMLDVLSFDHEVKQSQEISVVILPFDNSPVVTEHNNNNSPSIGIPYESSFLFSSSVTKFLEEINKDFELNQSQKEYIIADQKTFYICAFGFTSPFFIAYDSINQRELPMNSLATLLCGRDEISLFGNVALYAYERKMTSTGRYKTSPMPMTVHLLEDIFGISNRFRP